VQACIGRHNFLPGELVQSLWSGYGEIRRLRLCDSDTVPQAGGLNTLIAKWIDPPLKAVHPRGWSTPRSHQRKLSSYQVEKTWYTDFAELCPAEAEVPNCF